MPTRIDDYLTLGQVAEYSGVSRVTLWRMVKERRLPAYTSPRDRRAKLVRRDELDAALRPVPLHPEPAAPATETSRRPAPARP